ncbi:MAG: competence/damage-inducible protein A [Candidatus Limnocylindria bacterium]
MADGGAPRGEILSVGTELLLGEIVDTNAAFLAGELSALGVEVGGARQLADDRVALREALAEARARASLVVVTGGLGPTHDDVTREALADALGESLTVDPAVEAALRERFRRIGPMPERNLRQAMRIPSAEALPNPIGSAPGWWVDRDDRVVALLPGVPSEMRRMWSEQVVPRLPPRFELRPLHRRVVRCFGLGESAVAALLGELLDGSDPDAGIYARDDGIHVRFSTRGDPAALDRCVGEAVALLVDDVYSTDDDGLADVALAALGRRGVSTVASRETGSGGALLSILADVPAREGAAQFVGGTLDRGGAPARQPVADVMLTLHLGTVGRSGVTRASIGLQGVLGEHATDARVFGSGPQRLRRGAFAAVDALRRIATARRN